MDAHEEHLKRELEDLENVQDDEEPDESGADLYTISSFGVDYTVEFLVKKLQTGQFYIPDFQRRYVWSMAQASRFIESLLLGLPVPGIFLFKETDSPKHLVIDGQQRLKSVQFFYQKEFNGKLFKLSGLKSKWNGLTYEELEDNDRLRLDDGVIHTTVFRQDAPQEGMASVYEVFERINTGGVKLSAQEIRSCVLYGEFNNLLFELNRDENWRLIYGPESVRLKDVELILRFFTFLSRYQDYKRPVNNFLSDYMESNRNPSDAFLKEKSDLFRRTVSLVSDGVGRRAFRPERALNTAVYDSFMVAVGSCIEAEHPVSAESVGKAYDTLMANSAYREATGSSTAGEESVKARFPIAQRAVEDHAPR